MSYRVEDITDQTAWDQFVCSHDEANFLHAWQWGEFHASRGRTVVRRGIYDNEQLVGVYAGHIEPARRGKHMQIVGGPITNWDDSNAVTTLFDDIREIAANHGCVYVRLRPQLEASEQSSDMMKQLGLRPAPMYLSVELAGVLDITKPEEDVLKNMRQRLRRALRKAEKNNITVETSTNPDDIHEFYRIQLETAGRHNFVAFSEDFLLKQFAAFASTGNAVLYTARHEGEILAQNFMIFYGNEASYHYGVSTALGTKLSGAPLLHMQAMRDARERGIGRYNFWGIVDENDTKHRFYGVSVFKRGFGVSELAYTPAHDIVINKLRYFPVALVDGLRRKRRHV